ncbi:hypothetical protein FTX61_08295 [Nitriliruptoraceae bacterium ZYF776]|nr:hypothetical protein [Profundirhabdus halotolerans]
MKVLVALLALVVTVAGSEGLPRADAEPRPLSGRVADDTADVRHTVRVELSSDGTATSAELHRDASGDGVEVTEVDADELPVVALVRYRLDGRTVDADELAGASGEVELVVEVRNLTAAARTVALPGSGGEVVRDVPLPLTATTRLHLGDGWQAVEAPGARVSADTEHGGTRLDWSTPLFPPAGDTSARLRVMGTLDGGAPPGVRVDVTPVTADSAPALAEVARQLEDRVVVDAVSAFLTEALRTALATSAEGVAELAAGLGQLLDGLAEGGDELEPPDLEELLDDLPDPDLDELLGDVDLEDAFGDLPDPEALLEDLLAELDPTAQLEELLAGLDPAAAFEELDVEALLAGLDPDEAFGDLFDLDAALDDLDPAALVAHLLDTIDLGDQLRELADDGPLRAAFDELDEVLDELDGDEVPGLELARAALARATERLDELADRLAGLAAAVDDLDPDEVAARLGLDELVAALDPAALLAALGIDPTAAFGPEAVAPLLEELLAGLAEQLPTPELPDLDPADLLGDLDLDDAFTLPDPADLLDGLELPDTEALLDAFGADLDDLGDDLGLDELEARFEELEAALGEAAAGSDELAAGLERLGAEGLGQLLDQLEADADRAREELAVLRAAFDRAGTARPTDRDPATRHVRYELVLAGHTGGGPWWPAGIVGVVLLGAGAEVARRRWLGG